MRVEIDGRPSDRFRKGIVAPEAEWTDNPDRTGVPVLLEDRDRRADRVLATRANIGEDGQAASVRDVVLVVNEKRRLAVEGKDQDRLTADGIAGKVLDLVRCSAAPEGDEDADLCPTHNLSHRLPPALELPG